MPDPAKFVYRVNFLDGGGNVAHSNVLATNAADAAAFVGGATSVVEVAANVEVVGQDKPHLKAPPPPPVVVPPSGLTPAEVEQLKKVFASKVR